MHGPLTTPVLAGYTPGHAAAGLAARPGRAAGATHRAPGDDRRRGPRRGPRAPAVHRPRWGRAHHPAARRAGPGHRVLRPARPRRLAGRGPGRPDRSAGLRPRCPGLRPLRSAGRDVATPRGEPPALPILRGGAGRGRRGAQGAGAHRSAAGHPARLGHRRTVGRAVRLTLARPRRTPRPPERALWRLGGPPDVRPRLVAGRCGTPGPPLAGPRWLRPRRRGLAAPAVGLFRRHRPGRAPGPGGRRGLRPGGAGQRSRVGAHHSSVAPRTARGTRGQLLPGVRAPALRRRVDHRRGAARTRRRRRLEPPRGRAGLRPRRGPRPERARRRDPRRDPLPAPRAPRRGRAHFLELLGEALR